MAGTLPGSNISRERLPEVCLVLAQVPQLIRGIGVGTVKGHGGAKMSRKPTVEQGLRESKPELTHANDQSHKPAKHIEETARLASSVETSKNPAKVRRTND
jgi:hypothetical protein